MTPLHRFSEKGMLGRIVVRLGFPRLVPFPAGVDFCTGFEEAEVSDASVFISSHGWVVFPSVSERHPQPSRGG